MNDLWLKFPDDAAFTAITTADGKRAWEAVFDTADEQSPWRAALGLIGLPVQDMPMIKWHRDAPYFNAAALAGAASGGGLVPEKTVNGGYRFVLRPGMAPLWSMLRAQWRITRFRARMYNLPDSLPLSLALGIVMQSHMIRLGPQAAHLADYLAAPDSAPAHLRALVADLQALQMKRSALSPFWHAVLAHAGDVIADDLPEFFWNEPPARTAVAASAAGQGLWKGLPVCAGAVTGLAVAMDRDVTLESLTALRARYNAPLVLVFRAARPQSVEFFPVAQALLFCEGGALSHACTIARDRHIPCVTALGTDLWARLTADRKLWLEVDGAAGTAAVLTAPSP